VTVTIPIAINATKTAANVVNLASSPESASASAALPPTRFTAASSRCSRVARAAFIARTLEARRQPPEAFDE
jgi:hypothetical protein